MKALFAPLAVLLLLAAAVTLVVWLEPRSLYTLALSVAVVCLALFGWAVVARTRTPRNDPPTVAELHDAIRRAAADDDAEDVGALLRRLGSWPYLLERLPADDRVLLGGIVRRHRLTADLRRRMAPGQPPHRRAGAMHLLAWLDLPGAELDLVGELDADDPIVAENAASALVRLGSASALDAVLRRIGQGPVPDSRLAALLEHAPPATLLPALRRAAAEPHARRHFWIAHLAGHAADPDALDLLLALSHDPVLDVRANAAESLGRLGVEDARPRLHEMLRDPSWVVRSHAASALGDIGPAPSVEALAALLGGDEWWVRENVVRALEVAGPAAAGPIRDRLASLSGEEREAALDVLRLVGGTGDADASPGDGAP